MKHLLIILLILIGIIFPQELPKYAPGQAIVIFDQIAYSQIQNELLQESIQTSNPDANQLFSSLQATRIQNILKKDSFDSIEEESGLNRSFVIYFPAYTDEEIENAVNDLKKSYLIEDAFPNALGHELADPNDPHYNQTTQYNLYKIKMSQAWDIQKGNNNIRIAILDWGFQPTHQELDNKIYVQKDYTDLILSNYQGWSFPNEDVVTVDDDATGLIEHGTDVAQVAAAETNNGYGIAGVGWNTPLVLVRCGFQGINPSGSTITTCETDDAINAINWIRTSGYAKVINISFGWTSSPSPLLQTAINSCISAGIIVVAAAGNIPGGSVYYPAAYSGVIAVSGTNQYDINDSWAQGPQVSVVAPANSIRTMNMSGGVKSSNGTSLAAPQVAGAVALILSQNPNLTPQVAKWVIEASAFKVPGMQGQIFHNSYGYGLLDVYEALRALNSIYVFKNVILSNENSGGLVIDNDIDHPVPSNSTVPVKYEANHVSRTDELPFLINWNGSGTTQKFNKWYNNSPTPDYNLQLSFTANLLTPPTKDANFYSTIPVTLINNFPEVGTLNPPSDVIWLKDPWFYYQVGNNWYQSNEFKSYSSPLDIQNNSTSSYGGVFQDQLVSSGTYYSVRSLPQDIDLGGSLGIRKFCFGSWGGTNAEFQSANLNQTGVVFTSSNAVVTANLKGSRLSNDITAYDYSNQKKFVRTDNGHLHNVYISMGALWYERSTNGGTTWDIVGGQPINSNNPKQVSIDYLPPGSGTEVVLIAYQCTTSTGSKVVIDVYIDGAPRAGQFRYDVVSFTHSPGEYSEMNAEPVISLAQEWDFLITYKVPGLLPEGGDDPTQAGLYYSFGWLNGLYGWQLTWYNPTQKWVMIPTTGVNSIHPTIGDDVYSGYNYFHIAYQENNQIKYHYRYGQTRTGSLMSGGNPYVCSNNTGFSQHYNPSIISMGTTARVCWVGYRMVYYEEENEVDAFPQYRVLFRRPGQTTFWQFGNNVSSPNINKNSTNTYYAFAWSESNSQIWFADNTLSTVRLLDDITGQQVQVSNGTTTTNMYCMTYEHNTGVPYYFERSNNLDSYYQSHKITNNFFSSGREGVVSVDSSEFYFALGDIEVDGQTINFIEIPDTIDVNDLNSINQCLITEPITLSDNSSFIYSVQYGLNDSLSAVQAITGDRFINFKILLTDDVTGQTIGEYDNVTYTQNNLYQYNNISYQVNTQGIGNRTARLKLVLDNNFESEYSLSRIFANESVLGKTTIKQISYSGSEVIKSYKLSQNYPNPFNPTTTIKFQIPKAGNVTLKVYDVLGSEVVTLVDEFKEVGKFEVNFNASSLASGVYIYRLNVNDYVNVKKMVLLK